MCFFSQSSIYEIMQILFYVTCLYDIRKPFYIIKCKASVMISESFMIAFRSTFDDL